VTGSDGSEIDAQREEESGGRAVEVRPVSAEKLYVKRTGRAPGSGGVDYDIELFGRGRYGRVRLGFPWRRD
jgi:hypothetical protein